MHVCLWKATEVLPQAHCGLELGQQEQCLQEPLKNRCQHLEAEDAGRGAGGLRSDPLDVPVFKISHPCAGSRIPEPSTLSPKP